MNFHRFVTVILVTVLAISFSMASMHKDGKKSNKTDHTCCAEKSEGKSASTTNAQAGKESDSKACCNVEKAGMKEGKANAVGSKTSEGTEKMDCCLEHDGTENVKTKSTDTKGTK